MAEMEVKPCELPMPPCRTLVKAQLIPADPTSSAQGRPRWLLWGEDDDGGFYRVINTCSAMLMGLV
ncbi:hypothetical protein JMJ77_0006579 [Colletotrichum scovillei]|uniref:Uncharacterized protein n=1 Tax=Colletotrichum scovillei TaxID=1209932 RepID=A0A9P7RIW7_9PEZI|nr:hypothetical protein JMJ77_0006579 [Colletotrichum scovillei]KAG7077757.1 hypothetical protein JMJ76_0015001 [Colletotrichum scovillei]KAG7084886.1 hypothetical protein JMJ78_0010316 [Colletotrichum scovillei]